MRVLVCTTGGAGHLLPLVPFTRALMRAGHEILVAAPQSRGAVVEAAGLPWRPVGEPAEREQGPIWARAFAAPPDAANAVVVRDLFGGLKLRAALPDVLALARVWRPDVILRESYELASAVAAERLGIPHVRAATGLASTEAWVLDHLDARTVPVEEIRAAPLLTLNPPAFDDVALPRTHRFRRPPAVRPRPLPDWWDGSDDPLVPLSFGSVAGQFDFFYPRIYRAAIDALAGMPARVLMTIGNAGDPAELGVLPANVHVERWVDQAAVLPHATALIGHGGYGTTVGALSAGVPLVVAPLFADQGVNARRVAALGAGIALPELGSLAQAAEAGPHELGAGLGAALWRVLRDPSFAEAARRVAASAFGLPPVSWSADVVEALGGVPAAARAA